MEDDSEFWCSVCQKRNRVMKRCTRCHSTIYCSRECQKADWPNHKFMCIRESSDRAHPVRNKNIQPGVYKDDGSIFGEEKGAGKDVRNKDTVVCHLPLVDFSKARKTDASLHISASNFNDCLKLSTTNGSKDSYLFQNELCYDISQLDSSQTFCNVIVKSNREKHNIDIQKSWSGQEVFKVLACKLKIPLDTLKIIHKGKVMTHENIQSVIRNKALFQAIGEQAANEEGLDKRDIDLMMKQLRVSRNEAVLALKKKGDIIDAMLEVGNK